MSRNKESQAWLTDAGEVVKTERANNTYYFAHFKTGCERVDFHKDIKGKWKHLGNWESYLKGELTITLQKSTVDQALNAEVLL